MIDDRVKELLVRSVVAQADDARQRRAWKDGMNPVPPRVNFDNGNIVAAPVEVVKKKISPIMAGVLGSSVVLGSAGVGSAVSMFYNQSNNQNPEVNQVDSNLEQNIDAIRWLKERGYSKPPE